MNRQTGRMIGIVLAAALLLAAMAGCAPAATGDAAGSGSAAASGISSIIMMVVLVGVFYFFMIRPENKRKKKLQEMRSALSVGDKITTIGGMVGKIVNISGDLITFETGEDRVRIQVTKWAISNNGIEKDEDAARA